MCVESTEKLKILEKPLNAQYVRHLLNEITLCSTCLHQNESKAGKQPSRCLNYHKTEFRNRLYLIAKEIEI